MPLAVIRYIKESVTLLATTLFGADFLLWWPVKMTLSSYLCTKMFVGATNSDMTAYCRRENNSTVITYIDRSR